MNVLNSNYTMELDKNEIEIICRSLFNNIQGYIYKIEDKYVRETYDCKEEFIETIIHNECHAEYELLSTLCPLANCIGFSSNIIAITGIKYDKAHQLYT